MNTTDRNAAAQGLGVDPPPRARLGPLAGQFAPWRERNGAEAYSLAAWHGLVADHLRLTRDGFARI